MSEDSRPWTDLKSTNLRRYRYSPETGELEIEFHSGASWTYIEVPEGTAADLAVADSPGKFFNANIKGKFVGAGSKALPKPPPTEEELDAARRSFAEDLRKSAEQTIEDTRKSAKDTEI